MRKVYVFAVVVFLFGLTFYFSQAGLDQKKVDQPQVMAGPNNNEGEPKI